MLTIENKTKSLSTEELEEMFQFAAKDTDLEATITVLENDKLLDKFSNDDVVMQAILQQYPMEHTYALFVRSRLEVHLREVVFHEICHLAQYESGRLKFDLKRKVYTFEGKKYTQLPEYMKRPWEVEAFDTQRALTKAWRNYKNQSRRKSK